MRTISLRNRRNNLYISNLINEISSYNNKIKCSFRPYDEDPTRIDKFTIKYTNNQMSVCISKLPNELNQIINSYLENYIELKYLIFYPENYPLQSSMWSMIDCNHNMDLTINLKLDDYYYNITENHNNDNHKNRSVETIEQDILVFISRINHYEYIETYTLLNNELNYDSDYLKKNKLIIF